jgi:hypothetical protein
MDTPLQDTDPLEEKLIRAGGLRLDDLAFNQAGELSPWQMGWLRLEVASWVVQIGIDLALIACIWLFYYFGHNLGAFIVGGLFWSFILGISMLMCVEHARPLWAAINGNRVESISGTILKHYGFGKGTSLDLHRDTSGVNWGLEIKNHRFSVHPHVYNSIVEHGTYRLFYILTLKRVISIEHLLYSHEKKQSALAALQERARENKE